MATIVVGVGDFAVSASRGDLLRTFALGSCIGVTMLDPQTGVTGLLHLVLPEAKTNPEKSRKNPAYFADTGIVAMVEAMERLGSKRSRRWVVKVAGGAKVLANTTSEAMEIGKRNILATKKNLWKLGLVAVSEDVGETHSRTVTVTVGEPEVLISNPARGETKL